jgi:hypothetical protein
LVSQVLTIRVLGEEPTEPAENGDRSMFNADAPEYEAAAHALNVSVPRLRAIVDGQVQRWWPWELEELAEFAEARIDAGLADPDHDAKDLATAGRAHQVLRLAVIESQRAWGLRDAVTPGT